MLLPAHLPRSTCQQHSHILQGWNSQAKAQFLHQLESQAICKPMDLGSSKSLGPKLTKLCPIPSKGDSMPTYGANTPFAHRYSFQNKQVYGHAIIPSIQDSWKNAACTVASATTLRSTDRLQICHHFKSPFLHPNLPTQLCQPLPPVLLWPAPPQPGKALAWHRSLWGLQLHGGAGGHSCLDAAASHTAVPGNGHCSTKLTVHLLLTADTAESGL